MFLQDRVLDDDGAMDRINPCALVPLPFELCGIGKQIGITRGMRGLLVPSRCGYPGPAQTCVSVEARGDLTTGHHADQGVTRRSLLHILWELELRHVLFVVDEP